MHIGLDRSRSPQRYAKLLRATGRWEASPLPALMDWALTGDVPPGLSRVQRWAGPGHQRPPFGSMDPNWTLHEAPLVPQPVFTPETRPTPPHPGQAILSNKVHWKQLPFPLCLNNTGWPLLSRTTFQSVFYGGMIPWCVHCVSSSTKPFWLHHLHSV